jgi:hypothetical protein
VKERIVVALKEPVCITGWGYETSRQGILDKMSNEVSSFKSYKQYQHEEIALGHSRFAHYREILPDVMMKLVASIIEGQERTNGDEQRHLSDELQARLNRAVVEVVVREMVGKKLIAGTPRSLFTKPIDTKNKGRWKYPWLVIAKRVVKTGKYRPSSEYVSYEGEHEYDGGGLDDMKTHVLLKLYRERLDGLPVESAQDIIVDRENTYDGAGERAAEILMRQG